jgi:hypothetical protein
MTFLSETFTTDTVGYVTDDGWGVRDTYPSGRMMYGVSRHSLTIRPRIGPLASCMTERWNPRHGLVVTARKRFAEDN